MHSPPQRTWSPGQVIQGSPDFAGHVLHLEQNVVSSVGPPQVRLSSSAQRQTPWMQRTKPAIGTGLGIGGPEGQQPTHAMVETRMVAPTRCATRALFIATSFSDNSDH